MLEELEKYKNDLNNLQILNSKLTKENNDFRAKLYKMFSDESNIREKNKKL